MNKMGWFFSGINVGILIFLTLYGNDFGFNNNFIFPYAFGIIMIILNFAIFYDKKEIEGNSK